MTGAARKRPTPPPRATGSDVFADRRPAVAALAITAPPPPVAAPAPSAPSALATAPAPSAPPVQDAQVAVEERVPTAPGAPNAIPTQPQHRQPEPGAPPRASSDASAPPAEVAPASLSDPPPLSAQSPQGDRLDRLIADAVSAAREEPESVAAMAAMIADMTDRAPAALTRLMTALVQVPSVGKVPTPLEIAPHLHEHVKSEVASARRRSVPSTMTSVVLAAIGEAHESGRLAALAAAHKAGEKQAVPLFGKLTVGTAPRGTTVRLQFAPDSTPKLMTEILTAWHRVPLVVLVRLVLEDRYKRTRKTREVVAAEQADANG